MRRATIDLWVGVFVLAGVAALIVLAFKIGNAGGTHLENPYSLQAHFDNIGGLKPQAPIKSAGVVVGRVESITLDKTSYQALVKLSVDSRYSFPKDTFATINTSGLLGEQYIGLEAGGDEVNLKAGDTIRKTQSAIVLEKLISQFMFNKAEEVGTQK